MRINHTHEEPSLGEHQFLQTRIIHHAGYFVLDDFENIFFYLAVVFHDHSFIDLSRSCWILPMDSETCLAASPLN